MAVKHVLGSKPKEKADKKKGEGTSVAEYSEGGPYSCFACWYLKSVEPRKETHGLCTEPHMLRDPEVKKVTIEDDTYAVVQKYLGCCRYVDAIDPGERNEDFTSDESSEDEAAEHA